MKQANLRDYYPFYTSDYFRDVTDEISELFKQLERKEHADYERRRVRDGIERDERNLWNSPQC